MSEIDRIDMLYIAADIVTAYVGRNELPAKDIPDLMDTVFRSVQSLANPDLQEQDDREPAIPVDESVTDEFIYSGLVTGVNDQALTEETYEGSNGGLLIVTAEGRADFSADGAFPA